MTKIAKVHGEEKPQKKHMWFGYGNYGGQPFLQIGGGYVRDPGPVEKLWKTSHEERSPWSLFLYITLGLLALMLLGMLGAWVIVLFVG